MKISIKLTASFLIITLLVVFVGYFGFTSSNTIQKNNQIVMELVELENILDHSLVQVLQLIETQTFDSYYATKSNIEDLRKEFDMVHEKNEGIIHKFTETFDRNVDEFTKISNGLMAVHKEKLAQNIELIKKQTLEKNLRHEFSNRSIILNNPELSKKVGSIQYYSKEALYQYKDQTHIDIWLNSIGGLKKEVEKFNLPQDEKKLLLQNINTYLFLAPTIGEIVIEQKETEVKEDLKIVQLMGVIDSLEEDEIKIINNLEIENKSLNRGIYLTLLIIIIISFIASIVFGLYITRSISKPVQELAKASKQVEKGNLNYKIKIESKDEIRELANSFDEMRLGLKDRNDLLNTLLKTFKGKFGNIATILVRKNIQEMIKKNPRIEKFLPKSLGISLTKAKNLQREKKKLKI